ncbi:MAG: helix-turn-helix transcriptional regulator [Proteobacteria bacterium]|nr:helix-turn-helix transcriptional regulator [Pseudomonadota bacterium]
MIKYEEVKKELLEDHEVAKEYEIQKAEFDIARSLIKARRKAHMTQAEVAVRMHTSQSQIARMESGSHKPSFHSLYKYAQAVNQTIYIAITP